MPKIAGVRGKVVVGALAGAVVTLAIGVFQIVDPSVGDKITAVMAGAGVTVVSAALSFLIPEADQA
jgi:hypothetical protein